MNRRSGGNSVSSVSISFFEPLHVVVADRRFRHPLGYPRSRIGEPCTDGEQLLLDLLDLDRQIGINARRADRTEVRVQLVDLAVRVHTRIGLRHARVVEERRVTRVAGLCVDPHA